MKDSGRLDRLLENQRTNTVLSWALVVFVGLVAVGSLVEGDLLWTGFAVVVAALAVVPPWAYRSPRVMLPWEVLLLAALPLFGRVVATLPLATDLATYLSVAALALVVAVELDVFTPVRMNDWFAVLFVVIATMAAAGVWSLVQWLSDHFLGTHFVLPRPPVTDAEEAAALNALMWDYVAATVAGLLAGVLFVWYFRRRRDIELRLPEGVHE
ncbi:hypothetical protein [Halospeciosus flavus]|uniref:Uncharacterized protein n=1 Tax=Halospeciosus flavus TaxID=3032283 RepID=A0ABD5Z8T8_9EURY|nr:hypothetical protein [Halospeciosus flavus]